MIIFQQNVLDYFDDLIHILFKEEYFGFVESSEIFVDKIIDFVYKDIYTFPSKKTPKKLIHLGSNYIFYKSNQRTTWYVFFEQFDNNYLITSIINSNSEEVKFL